MDISEASVKSILTPQKYGFLTSKPFPFTHTASPYTGCPFGQTYCGTFCYAQFMPNWTNGLGKTNQWGHAVTVKRDAAEVLDAELKRAGAEKRRTMRIFLASTTDPWNVLEGKYHITRQMLEVFSKYDDLDLLVLQTRSLLAEKDFDLIAKIPYAWLSVTIETNSIEAIKRLGGGVPPLQRIDMVMRAANAGLKAQIAVSPMLPLTIQPNAVEKFGLDLITTSAKRFIVDTFEAGDGSRGKRTENSPFGKQHRGFDWRDNREPLRLYEYLKHMQANVGWSAEGFCGIPPRQGTPKQEQLL